MGKCWGGERWGGVCKGVRGCGRGRGGPAPCSLPAPVCLEWGSPVPCGSLGMAAPTLDAPRPPPPPRPPAATPRPELLKLSRRAQRQSFLSHV